MGWRDIVHKAGVVLGTDEDKTVADEAAEELAKEAKGRKEEGKQWDSTSPPTATSGLCLLTAGT